MAGVCARVNASADALNHASNPQMRYAVAVSRWQKGCAKKCCKVNSRQNPNPNPNSTVTPNHVGEACRNATRQRVAVPHTHVGGSEVGGSGGAPIPICNPNTPSTSSGEEAAVQYVRRAARNVRKGPRTHARVTHMMQYW